MQAATPCSTARPRPTLLPLCQTRNVPLIIGGVLNSGILATGPIPGAKFNYEPASPAILTKVQHLDEACHRAGTTLLSAALRFPLASPIVASVLIGAATPASLSANLTAAQATVPPDLFRQTAAFALRS